MDGEEKVAASGPPAFPLCECADDTLPLSAYVRVFKGIDKTNGRFGEVHVDFCERCGRPWLHYFMEVEGEPRSARWFRGGLTRSQSRTVTAENAITTLEAMEWYDYGGSYFYGKKGRGEGRVPV